MLLSACITSFPGSVFTLNLALRQRQFLFVVENNCDVIKKITVWGKLKHLVAFRNQ